MIQQLETQALPFVQAEQLVGTEWIVDASGCSANSLKDLERIKVICADVISDLGLHAVGQPLAHQFPAPGGVTVLTLLSESHLACHTYPEFHLATFNLYCCRERPAWDWDKQLRIRLEATSVTVRQVARGDLAVDRGAT